jgi:Repeat of unknown function (DUF5648)
MRYQLTLSLCLLLLLGTASCLKQMNSQEMQVQVMSTQGSFADEAQMASSFESMDASHDHHHHHHHKKDVCPTPPVPSKKIPKVNVYRYWNGKDHFYTTSCGEIGTIISGQVGHYHYKSEGVGFYGVLKNHHTKKYHPAPVYRYWNGKDHFYTTNSEEIGTTTPGHKGKHHYKSEGVGFYGFKKRPGHGIKVHPIHRYWNGVEHFYTTDPKEIGTTEKGKTGKYGYKYEGVGWYAPA